MTASTSNHAARDLTRRELLTLARAGDADAQLAVALSYDLSKRKNFRLAAYWYRKAAEQGHREAQNFLAEFVRDHAEDRRQAILWFRRAAEQGESNAQLSLGYSLYYGEGTTRDRTAALKWYRLSARQGNAGAMYNIAMMYRDGSGLK